jgi:hypothetical protein
MIKFKDVTKVYRGKKDACMCGCRGEYYIPSHVTLDDANADVGYDAYDEHSDDIVKRVISKLNTAHNKMDDEVRHLFINEKFAYADVGNRTYTAYFGKED